MFKNSLPGIMAGLTRQFGLMLRFGSNPKTNGKIIWMPNMPLQVGERDKIKLMGDLIHECGHITQTSFTVLRDAKLTNSAADQLLHGIWNAVEDVRMERDTMKDLLGARKYLTGSLAFQTEDGQVRTGASSPSDAIITYCYCKGAILVNAFMAVKPSYESSKEALTQLITEDGVALVDVLLDAKMPLLRSGKKEGTSDSFALAREVVELLKQMSQGQSQQQKQPNQEHGESGQDQEQAQADQDQNQESQQHEGSQNSDDESDDGEQEANGQQSDEDEQDSESEGDSGDQSSNEESDAFDHNQGSQQQEGSQSSDDESNDGEQEANGQQGDEDEAESQKMSQGAQAILDDNDVDPSEFSQHDKVREEIIEKAKAEGAAFTNDIGEKGDESAGGLSDEPSSKIKDDKSKYAEIKSAISGDIAQLRRRLIPKLESINRSTTKLTEDRGRLDIRAAIRGVVSGDSNPLVYRVKVKQRTIKPAITLLLDRSGSMGTHLMQSAQEASIALLEVCDAAAIKVEVIAFDDNIDMLKSFDMPTQKAKAKLGGVDANGGTDTAKAMYHAGKRLIKRPEGRKIMMVITDGRPASVSYAKSVHDLLKSSGIEVYGLGLGTEAVNLFCERYTVVNSANLATTVLQALDQ